MSILLEEAANVATRPVRVLSCFSGIGALDLGVGRVLGNARTVLYVERELPAVRILAARMEDGSIDAAPVWSDVRTVPDYIRADLVCGGFPCQDLSTAGARAGLGGTRSGLFYDMVRAAEMAGCRFMFLENVPGIYTAPTNECVCGTSFSARFDACPECAPEHEDMDCGTCAGQGRVPRGCEACGRSLGDGRNIVRALAAVARRLAEGGWDAIWTTLRASDVGAPHQRARWFCLAWRRVGDPVRPELQVEEASRADGEGGADAPGAGGELADAERTRREAPGERRDEHAGAEPQAGDGGGLPQWPPAPNDAEGWAYVLERWPDLAPAVEGARVGDPKQQREQQKCAGDQPGGEQPRGRGATKQPRPGAASDGLDQPQGDAEAPQPPIRRVADGAPGRVDRLRALGNAVVPAQAEAALRHLIDRAPAWVREELR